MSDTILVIQEPQPVNILLQGVDTTFYITELAIEDGDTYTVQAGKYLMSIVVEPDAADRVISVGYAAEGTDLVDNEEIPGGTDENYTIQIHRSFYTAKTLHFSGDSATVKLYIF